MQKLSQQSVVAQWSAYPLTDPRSVGSILGSVKFFFHPVVETSSLKYTSEHR